MELKNYLLVAVLVSAALAGPAGQRNSECASECSENKKFFYEIGRKYEYKYEAETRTGISGTFSDEAVVKVSALATIQPVTSCEFILSLSEVSLPNSDKSELFATEVTRRTLRFAVDNGKIEHICGSDKEPSWVINFKKGILSSFQNSMKDLEESEVLTETDVSGICETSYTSVFKDSEIVITKSKTPSECSHKPKIQQKLSSFGYTFDSLIQGLPIMESTQKCKQYINNEIIEKVDCEESHIFQPFKQHGKGAQTITKTTFELFDVKPSSSYFESFNTKNNLLFDYSDVETKETSLEATETILSKIDLLTQNGIKKDVPSLFSELVSSLRDLSNLQIQSVYQRCGKKLQSFIIDALPLVRTAEAMGTYVDLILKGEIPEKERDIWFTSLAFVQNPTIEMISAVEPLLESTSGNKALLGISTLIHNYCEKNENCEFKPVIEKVLKKIESRLGVGCRSTTEEEKEDIIYALKSLGNVGRFINAESVLKRCYLEENPMEVRSSAIDAWRRAPCSYDRDHLMSAYIDQYQDNEIRISAYLALMKCPTQEIIDTVKDRLTSESVNQVASFVWTHLTNLQESAAPGKQWVRELIGEELLQKKFTPGALKLSGNYESSFYLKEQKFGASMDSNVIFSEKSFIPRSSMMNLTIDLFGESVNLFELGGRIEGFEKYIEKFFGPDGYYPEETVAAIIKNLRNSKSDGNTNLEPFITTDTDEPKGSYYLKLFGNELLYKHFDGIENLFPEKTFTNIFDMVMELVKKGSIDYTKSYNLVSSEFTFPTITGFPLSLKLDGKATIEMKLEGNFKFESLTSIDIQGKLRPSAAVMFDSSMMVDAFVTKSGMKMISTLHSSTAVEGKAKINGGKLVDLMISVPDQKTEIYEMTNEFFKIENGIESAEVIPGSDIKNCFPILSPKTGLEMCYERMDSRTYEGPSFPLSGPYKSKLFLKKTSSHSAYVFHYSHTPEKTVLLIDMPDSTTDSKWSASLSHKNKNYELDLYSPMGTAKGMFSYMLDENQVGIEFEAGINDVTIYKAKFNIAREIEKTHRQSSLEIMIARPDISNDEALKISGKTYYDIKSKSINAQLSGKGMVVPEFTTRFNLNRSPSDNSLSFDIESTPFELTLSGKVGNLDLTEGSIALKGKYRLMNSPSNSLTTQVDYTNQKTIHGRTFTCTTRIDEFNFSNFVKVDYSNKGLESKIEGKMSDKTWNIENAYTDVKTNSLRETTIKQITQIPSMNVDNKIYSHMLSTDDKFVLEKETKIFGCQQELKLVWNYAKQLSFNLNALYKDKSPYGFNLEVTKISELSYNLQVIANMPGYTKQRIEGSFNITELSAAKIDANVKGLYSYDDEASNGSSDFIWTLTASESELKSETNLNQDGLNRFLIVHATKSSLSINTNFIKPFSADAKIESNEEEKRFFINSNFDETIFEVSGKLSDKILQGTLKYKEQEIKISAGLRDHGVDFEVQLSPEQRLALFVNYGLGREMFLEVSLETPIKDWEKQDMRLSLTFGPVIQGQASVTWKNSQHIGLTVEWKDDSSFNKMNYSGSIRFASTIEDYERFELNMKYARSFGVINTKIDGKWNSDVIKGNFDAYPVEDDYKLNMSLKSPLTEDFSLSFDFKLTRQDIATSVDVVYGTQKSRILFKGNLIDFRNMNASFICFSPYLPEININVSLQTSSASKSLEIKGKYNGQKILLLANCENFVNNQDRVCKMALKIVTSSYKLFNGNFSNKITSENGFESDVELSSSFISDQSIKGHIEGRFSSPYSAAVTGYLSGPNLSGRINITHHISNQKIQTEGNLEVNSFRVGIVVGGNIDLTRKEGFLHAETESTYSVLDGYKIILQHSKEDTKRETQLTFNKKEKSVKIYHAIIFRDPFNWSSYLKINDLFSLTNDMESTAEYVKHFTNISWLQDNIDFTFQNNYGSNLNLIASLNTPWTSLIRATLLHEKEDSKRISRIKLEYDNNKNMLIESEYELEEAVKYIKMNILNENWSLTPWQIVIKLENGIKNSVDISLQLSDKFKLTYQMLKQDQSFDGIFNFNSYFVNPTAFTCKYSSKSDEKGIYFEYVNKQTSSFDLKLKGNRRSGTITSIIQYPRFSNSPITTNVAYDLSNDIKIVVDNTMNETKCMFDTVFNSNEFVLKSTCPHGEGKLNIKWQVDEYKKYFSTDIISPFQSFKNTYFSVKYDAQLSKNFEIVASYGNHRITSTGKLNIQSIDLEATTTFEGWTAMSVVIEYANAELNGVFTKESQTIKLTGKGNFNYSSGEAEMTIISPFQSFENNVISFKYANTKSTSLFFFNSQIGENILKLDIQSSTLDDTSKQVKFDIQSPWNEVKKVYLEATIQNLSIKLNGNFNKYYFDSILRASQTDKKDITVLLSLTSNIQGWTVFSIESNVFLTKTPYRASLILRHEDQEQKYSLSFDLSKNSFDFAIYTPNEMLENFEAKGSYNYKKNKFETTFALSRNNNNFKISGLVDVIDQFPNININVQTPYELYKNIELILTGSLITDKSVNLSLKLGEVLSKVSVDTKLFEPFGTATLSLSLPLFDIQDKNIQLSYNFENDKKYVMLDVKRGSISERFYIEGSFAINEFSLTIESPIENFKNIVVSGKYQKQNNEIIAYGKVMNEENIYRFEGKVSENKDGYKIETTLPLTQYDTLVLNGEITKEKLLLKFIKGNEEQEILINYMLKPNKTFIKINTPFENFSYFAMGADYDMDFESVKGNVFVYRNEERFNIGGAVHITPQKSYFKVSIKASQNINYSVNIFYDFLSKKKEAGISYEYGSEMQKYLLETTFDGVNHGFVKIYTTRPGYELNGFEYKFKTLNMADTETFITFTQNSKETSFGFISRYNKNELIVKLLTPFENYEEFGIESNITSDMKEGKAKIMIGSYILCVEASLKPNDFYICIETPYKTLEIFKFISKYGYANSNKFINIEFVYNDIKYLLNGKLNFSAENPTILLSAVTPFEQIKEFETYCKLNIYSPEELFDFNFKYNDIIYAFKFGYKYSDYEGFILSDIKTPIEGWTNIKFNAKMDFNSDAKVVDVKFEHKGDVKRIYFSGKLLDGEVDFDVQTPLPIATFENFKTRGSLSRSKRSVEFMMMNDDSSGGIVASFHSVKITASTPFEKAKDISFEITRDTNGGWKVNYQRNENKVFFNFSAEPKKKGFNITIESEVPGWEFLALAGRLDPEEIKAYIEGQIDSGTLHISGNGVFGDKSGSMTVTSHSSFEKYQEVITKIEYNAKRNIFTFDSRSSSSDYKILIEFKRGLFIEVLVPNDEQNTVASGKLTVFKGNLKISSRFPKIKTFEFDYNLELGQKITSKILVELNGVNLFELEFERDSQSNKAHLQIHGRRGENHSQLHFHREGWDKLEFTFNRNGKEFKVDITGSGDIPQSGTLEFTLSNSFREVPRTYSGKLDIDRTSSPKKLTLEVQLHNGKVYIFYLTYDASLQDLRHGEFTLRTSTPDRSMAPWKDISGNWSFDENNEGKAILHVGPKEFTASGKIGILESNLVFESNAKDEKYFAQWKINKSGKSRDYFLKLGPERTFFMFKLKGTFDTIYNGDVSGAFQFSRIMKNEFTYTSTWTRTSEGLSGGGTFNIGDYSGTHTLTNFKRDPVEKAATFHWEAKSNIPKFTTVVLHGEYNLRQRYLDIKLSWDTDEISLKGSLQGLASEKSENTIKFHLPKYGDSEITITHDCTNPHDGYFKVIGHIGTAQASLIANWSSNEDFTKFKLHLERDFPIGKATLHVEFDTEDINNAKGNIQYNVGDKFVTIDLSRVKTETNVHDEIVYKSDLTPFKTARVHVNADWSDGFNLDSGIEWNDKAIEAHINIGSKSTTAKVTTPFERFGNINVNIDYDLKPKSKTIVLKYTRGDQEAHLELNIKTPSKKSGTLNLSVSTPFEVLKTLTLEASWKKGDLTATYKRNDLTYNVEGKAEIKSDLSSFDLKFTLPSGKSFEIQFSFDLEGFIKGTETSPKDLINVKFHLDDDDVSFNVKGFRTSEKLYIEIHETTSIGPINTFSLKLDSELNLNDREGSLEVKADEFYFNLRNSFEKRSKGFYARSQIDSSLTNLPGLTIGFGRDGDSFIFTTGWGDEREITFTLKGKDHFHKGFYGTIDLPKRGIHGLEFSVDYSFTSDDELHVGVKVQISEGKEVDVDILYNSDGVKGRLSTPWTGRHSARAKRSISNDYFLADIGVDNYGLSFESSKTENSFKKGFKIEGFLFGEKYFFSGFINADSLANAEGKLIIETPFKNYEKILGFFKTKFSNKKYYGQLDINLIYPISAKIDIDLINKVKGDALVKVGSYTYEVTCDFTSNEYKPMKGKIIIKTPHVSFDKIVIDATIDVMSINNFQGFFLTDILGHNFNLNINFKQDFPTYNLDATFGYDNKFEYRVISEYSLTRNPFYLKGKSSVFMNGAKLYDSKIEVNFKGINNMHIAYETVCGKDHFNGTVLIHSDDEKINGEIKGKTKNEKNFGITFDIPTHMKQIFVNSYFENDKLHKLHFSRTAEVSYKKITLDIDSPTILKGSLDSTFSEDSSAIKTIFETPNGKNKFNLQFEIIPQTDGTKQKKLVSNLILDIPYYEKPITIYAEYENSSLFKDLTIKYKNQGLHVYHIRYEVMGTTKKAHITVESSLIPGNSANIIISVDFENKIMISLESTILSRINNIYIDIDNNGILLNCISPIIPTGMFKLEGSIVYESVKDIVFTFNFADASKTLTTEGKIKWDVNEETGIIFEIRTPFEEYRRMKFGIQYIKGDITRISMFAKPFNLEAETYFGVSSGVFNTGIKLKTGMNKYGLTKADAVIPLTKFEPKFSATFDGLDYELSAKFEKTKYGREISYTSKNIFDLSHVEMSYRAKAPYELNFEYDFKDTTKFGLMFDSSFLALKEVGQYLILF